MNKKKAISEVALTEDKNSAEGLIEKAITANVPVETMERLLVMRTQIKAEQGKEAFTMAMAKFQGECPVIKKTKEVVSNGRTIYKYAPIESIIIQVRDPLRDNGFSYAFEQLLTAETVKVGCVVTHSLGHSNTTWMEVRLGTKTGVMSNSQQDAAASTFAKRYAFCNAFGILTGDEDTDGANFDRSPVSAKAVPTVTYDDPEEEFDDTDMRAPDGAHTPPSLPTDPLEQRKRIFSLLKGRGVDITDGKACRTHVADVTELELVENNYPKIIERLEAYNI